jgi:photosystem II stability/assembly factor-like uncharacterized protein
VRAFGTTLLVEVTAGGTFSRWVFRSTDAGGSWNLVAAVPDPGPSGSVAFVTASRWLQLVVPGQSRETIDGGITWHAYPSDYAAAAGVPAEVVFGDAEVGYATVQGELLRTVDSGLHWRLLGTPGTR